jgi:hypothetical protein
MSRRLCRLAAASIAAMLAASAAAQDFRPLALPPGFYERAAERDRPPVPEAERARVVDRASADFSPSSYYNRPGSDWERYLRDWYGCEQATDGSRIPGGQVAYLKSPSLLSPRETGMGVTIGGAIGHGESLDTLHEENRRACMRTRGWRRVAPGADEARRIAALDDAGFKAWAAGAIGSAYPAGQVEGAFHPVLPRSREIEPDAAPRGDPTLRLPGGGDPRVPLAMRPGEGLLLIAFRRPDRGSAGQPAAITLRSYDLDRADLATPRSATTIESVDRQAGYELQAVRLPAGYYVIDGTSVDGKLPAKSNCFGAPVIEIPAGQAVYGGDWVPYRNVKLGKGKVLPDTLVLVAHLDQAKAALARFQPALAATLQPIAVANGARYTCTDPNIVLDRWSLAGVAEPPAR